MQPSAAVEIQLTDQSAVPVRVAGVPVGAVLYVNGRERYRFHVGVTDSNGRTRISYEILESCRRDNAQYSLMDYNTPLQDCDDMLGIEVPAADDLQRRLASVNRWFPGNSAKMLALIQSLETTGIAPVTSIQVRTGAELQVAMLPVRKTC